MIASFISFRTGAEEQSSFLIELTSRFFASCDTFSMRL